LLKRSPEQWLQLKKHKNNQSKCEDILIFFALAFLRLMYKQYYPFLTRLKMEILNTKEGDEMGCRKRGFCLLHVVGAAAIFLMGMRFAVRRMSLPIMAYRLFKMLR
jgi:hypothetical protein